MWTLLGLLLLFLLVRFWAYHGGSASTGLEAKPATAEKPAKLNRPAEPEHSRSARLRYLASCPSCGERLTRRDYFSWQFQIRRSCRKCQTPLKSNFKLDTIWSLITVSPFAACFFLASSRGSVSWFVVVAAALLHLAAGFVLFPYNTKLEIAGEIQKSNTTTPVA